MTLVSPSRARSRSEAMDDQLLKTALDRLVAPASPERGWDDVLARAGQLRRRRGRRRGVFVSVAATCVVLGASLAASGQIASLLPHSRGPYFLLRSRIVSDNGIAMGTMT